MRTQNCEEEETADGKGFRYENAAQPTSVCRLRPPELLIIAINIPARTKETAQASPRIPQGPCCHWTTAHDKIGSVGCMRRLQGAPAYTVADLKRGRVLCALSGPQRGFDTSRPGRLERAASSQRSIQAQSRTLVLLRPK